ncbi:MAG: GntR family transcriptional regulator [Christensenella sp.]|uniref:GntR family transcriptional regulator n=1 Tax=Christensenella sp. TaxID=1935934 RepID=UPI002B1F15E9|nr:GntR family transcriptional regulator [Christensenella sp.]MEA5004115.1 GntR family transcriptional regulator [Christensenella sp.]
MIRLDKTSKQAIYEQIVQGFKALIMTGKVRPHEQLPSVRKLAKQLGVNPNTVQKSYAILAKEGFLYSVAGKGDFAADNAAQIKDMRKSEIREMFIKATKEARDSGLWIDEIFAIVDEAYSSN